MVFFQKENIFILLVVKAKPTPLHYVPTDIWSKSLSQDTQQQALASHWLT